jgi:hypothetical protein
LMTTQSREETIANGKYYIVEVSVVSHC